MESNRLNFNNINCSQILKAKTIVIKIGSSILIDPKRNILKNKWLNSLLDEISILKKSGKNIIIVSSGSIALGKSVLKLTSSNLRLDDSQAYAAIGQIKLAQSYDLILKKHNIHTAQVLLTSDDSQNRRRYLNIRSTFKSLLKKEVIPIVNENDTVATEEIKFGDNDRLAAQVALITEANLLILLSDIDGLYEKDPNINPDTKHLPLIKEVTKNMLSMASHTTSENSRGGMVTKLEAAKISMNGGCEMIIANGLYNFPISKFSCGDGKYTRFLPKDDVKTLRKQWILSIKTKGKLLIDQGAIKALINHKSLLPAGVIKSFGNFERGDAVEIISNDNEKIGQGLSGYSNFEVQKIKGCKTNEIKEKLGHPGRVALIHTDDLVLI
ncbi:MAG: glutamate 5-kinase [Paracoccaceae bacterium]